jgi:hypothetical protein
MGRFYSGNIHGKFWVGVQSTGCMEEHGAVLEGYDHDFASCGCCADREDYGTDFCQDCYDSREEHLKAIHEEDEEATTTTCENGCANFIMDRDVFEDQGKPFIEEHAEMFLKNAIDFKMYGEDKDYAYEYKGVSGVPSEEISTIADLCMLKQIEKFFEDNLDEESCCWWGEE